MVIHTVGDSHSSIHSSIYGAWGDCKNVITHHLGPVLCYSVGRDGLQRVNIRNFGLKNGDTIIFCFGEIDCRCHVHKYITEEISYKNIIDEIVNKYFDTIKLNIDAIKIDIKVCIYNVVPPVTWRPEKHQCPYLGTDNERIQYVLYFNQKLKQKCAEYKYIFFDVYDKYVDNTTGLLNYSLSDGNCHIKGGKYLQEFITENNL